GAGGAVAQAEEAQEHVAERQQRDPLRGPIGGDLRRGDAPQPLGVGAEELIVEGAAEAGGDPVLERAVGGVAFEALADVATDDARPTPDPDLAQDVVELERVAVAAAAVEHHAGALAEQEVLAAQVADHGFQFRVAREEAVAAEVEAEAVALDGAA